MGKEMGIDTAINQKIVNITKKIHAGEIKPSIENLIDFMEYS
jgi:hypothetical protein